jgi:hypothetical protein
MGQPDSPTPQAESRDAERELADAMRAERELHIRHPVWYWATLIGPPVVWGLLLALVGVRWGPIWIAKLATLIAVIEGAAGRFIILAGTQEGSDFEGVFLSPFQLFVLVTLIDATICAYACFHTGFVYRLPRVGAALMRYRLWVRERVLASRWARRSAFVTVLAYAAAPLWFTGGALASLLALAMGMSRPVAFVTVITGMTLGNALMLLAADVIARVPGIREVNPWLLVAGVCVLMLTITGMGLAIARWRSARSRRLAGVVSRPSSAPPAPASDATGSTARTTPTQNG